MQTKVSILFYAKKAKATTDGLVPIYQRVTVDGQRIEISTKRYVDITKWSSEAGKLKGNSEEARSLNAYLDILKAKVYDYQKDLIHEMGYVTCKPKIEKCFCENQNMDAINKKNNSKN